ncbi:YdcF family protein [Thermodesulfobacteriota bacterium]
MQTDYKNKQNEYTSDLKQRGKHPESSEENRFKSRIIKPLIFTIIILLIILWEYHAAFFTFAGNYLVLEHKPEKADLIVCLGGGNIERGLAASDAYNAGLAPLIYISRPRVPDGYDMLEGKNVKYPEEADLLEMFLKDLKISEKAVIRNDIYVENTFDEAICVKKEVEKRGFKSLIIITSPTHSRRAWCTFKKVFEGTGVRIFSLPTMYSKYNPETYWLERKYLKDVILEYQKFLFYVLKYGI